MLFVPIYSLKSLLQSSLVFLLMSLAEVLSPFPNPHALTFCTSQNKLILQCLLCIILLIPKAGGDQNLAHHRCLIHMCGCLREHIGSWLIKRNGLNEIKLEKSFFLDNCLQTPFVELFISAWDEIWGRAQFSPLRNNG